MHEEESCRALMLRKARQGATEGTMALSVTPLLLSRAKRLPWYTASVATPQNRWEEQPLFSWKIEAGLVTLVEYPPC